MKRPSIPLTLAALLLLLSAVPAGAGPDEAAQSYEVPWWTVDGGGATASSGGDYDLGGTIGQPDAGASSGGDYGLAGGFWVWSGGPEGYAVSLPLVLQGY